MLTLKPLKKALNYIEDEAGFTRRGEQGFFQEPSDLIFATFEHGTSRSQDPQLHTHAIALNVGLRGDGTTGALHSPHLYRHKMTAGALYRAELANNLKNLLSVQIKRTSKAFEVDGVSKGVIDEFSKRRKEILEAMADAGASGAKRASHFTMTTRERKDHVAREILFEKWQEVGKSYGFDIQNIVGRDSLKLAGEDFRRLSKDELKTTFVNFALEKITSNESHFTKKDVIRWTAQLGVGEITSREVRDGVSDYLKREAIHLGRGRNGEFYFTTKEIDALEKRMLSDLEEAKQGWHKQPRNASSEIPVNAKLNDEQKLALLSITSGEKSSIRLVSGMAGTGKTRLLRTAREVWEKQGYEVSGAALAGKAAKGMQDGSGIDSDTIHKTLFELKRGNLQLTPKSILVIDEAGMVGTRMMSELLNEVKKAKAQLILVGDSKQLQPIMDTGNPFKAIGDRLNEGDRTELIDVMRQKDDWAREAVKDFAWGETAKGLKAFLDRDLLTVSETRSEAIKELVHDWKNETVNYQESIMLAGTKVEVSKLNRLAQTERLSQGELGKTLIEINGNFVHTNDRVLFKKKDRIMGIENGEVGTVFSIDNKSRTVVIEMDDKRYVKIAVQDYDNLHLGYAVTTHSAQGITVDKAFILAGGVMQDRELSYTQISRSREQTKIYTERAEVGDTIADLSKRMKTSRMKVIAQDLVLDVQEQEQKSKQDRSRNL